MLAEIAERISREVPPVERPEQRPQPDRQADDVEREVGRDADGDRARRQRSRDSRGEDQGQQEQARVREQMRAGQDPRRGPSPAGEPERDVEEGLVDQIGEQRAEKERALLEGGKVAVRPGRDLLADAEMPEREHAAILNAEQRSAKRGSRWAAQSMPGRSKPSDHGGAQPAARPTNRKVRLTRSSVTRGSRGMRWRTRRW